MEQVGYYNMSELVERVRAVGLEILQRREARRARPWKAAGGGQPHNNMQPYAVVKYIICAI